MLDDPVSSDRLVPAIKQQRSRASGILTKVVRHLHSTWITPLDRHQIHELVVGLDGVIALAHSTGSRISLFGMAIVGVASARHARRIHGASSRRSAGHGWPRSRVRR
jgi:uncharacterized protein Yka (UPF0111/DUF47 family)